MSIILGEVHEHCSIKYDGRKEFIRRVWKSGVIDFNPTIHDTMKVLFI